MLKVKRILKVYFLCTISKLPPLEYRPGILVIYLYKLLFEEKKAHVISK